MEGSLRRGGERMELAQPLLLLESGLVIMPAGSPDSTPPVRFRGSWNSEI